MTLLENTQYYKETAIADEGRAARGKCRLANVKILEI